ncbi:MAG: hypothetical protein Q8Q50_14900 [Methylobacter sp.]|nr:hypothetical protein [Methylobacter sp.]
MTFKFEDGKRQFENEGPKALEFALENGCLNRADRGSLAVALFDLHDTSYYKDAGHIRGKIDQEKLKIIVSALIDEVEHKNWTNHAFAKQLNQFKKDKIIEPQKNRKQHVVEQLKKYGINYLETLEINFVDQNVTSKKDNASTINIPALQECIRKVYPGKNNIRVPEEVKQAVRSCYEHSTGQLLDSTIDPFDYAE